MSANEFELLRITFAGGEYDDVFTVVARNDMIRLEVDDDTNALSAVLDLVDAWQLADVLGAHVDHVRRAMRNKAVGLPPEST